MTKKWVVFIFFFSLITASFYYVIHKKSPLSKWAENQISHDFSNIDKQELAIANLDHIYESKDHLARFQIYRNQIYYESKIEDPRIEALARKIRFIAKTKNLPNVDFLLTLKPQEGPFFCFEKNAKGFLIPDILAIHEFKKSRKLQKVKKKYPWKIQEQVIVDSRPSVCSNQSVSDYVKINDFSNPLMALASESLLLMDPENSSTWISKGLKPYVHYLPLSFDESDRRKVQWALSSENHRDQMIDDATAFVQNQCLSNLPSRYLYELLVIYHKFQILEVTHSYP
jgi:hypothetical protein